MWSWLSGRLNFWYEAFSLWWLAVMFVWSLFSTAATIRDEFLSPERQERWRTLRVMPRLPLYMWIIGLLVITLLATMEGAYRAWRAQQGVTAKVIADLENTKRLLQREQEQNTPNLEGALNQPIILDQSAPINVRQIFIQMTIRNKGADTAIEGYQLKIEGPGLDTPWLNPTLVTGTWSASSSTGVRLKFEGKDFIYEKTVEALKRGNFVRGWLRYQVADIPYQKLIQPGTKLTVRFTDYLDREYFASRTDTGMQGKPMYLPGSGSQFYYGPKKSGKKAGKKTKK